MHVIHKMHIFQQNFLVLKMVLNAQKERKELSQLYTCHIPVFSQSMYKSMCFIFFYKSWNGTVWAKHICINHCHYQFNLTKSKQHVFPETYYFVSKIFLVPSYHNQELFCFSTISRHLLCRLHFGRIVYTNSILNNLQFLGVILEYTKFCHFIV